MTAERETDTLREEIVRCRHTDRKTDTHTHTHRRDWSESYTCGGSRR